VADTTAFIEWNGAVFLLADSQEDMIACVLRLEGNNFTRPAEPALTPEGRNLNTAQPPKKNTPRWRGVCNPGRFDVRCY
jgi:hypothetical protein